MALINWDESYSVDIKEIDEQHKRLFELMNKLFEAMNSGKGNVVLGKILDELLDYTRYHFGNEQKYFEKFGYPDTEPHLTAHQGFVDKIESFKTNFESKKLFLSMQVFKYLKNWINHHIKEIDKQYTAFFHENGLR